MILLKNCRLIPELSGGVECDHAVVAIADDRIVSVKDQMDMCIAPDLTIDCGGKTLLPGLIDLHIHLTTAGCGIGIEYADDFDLLKKACRNAKSYLAHGFTTVRDMGSTNGVASVVRDMIREGLLQGPRIFSSGRIILPTGILERNDRNTAYHSASGVEEIHRAVREEIGESHADVVKIYASGSAYNPGGEPTKAIMTREEIAAAVEMAGFRGRKVAAHCHSNTAIHYCIDAGVYTIEHASYIDDAGIEKMQRLNHSAYLVPTMTPYSYVEGSNPDPQQDHRASIVRKEMGQAIAPHMHAAYQAGLPLGFGTDVADGNYLTNGIGAEFRMRKELCGMRDLDILKQATVISAEILGMQGEIGEIREGYHADLILVNGEPDIDISAMYKLPNLVLKSGKIAVENVH